MSPPAWVPTCHCACSDTVPCTIFDPFAGSGTTLAVTRGLGRRSIGIELNPAYIALIAERLQEALLPLW